MDERLQQTPLEKMTPSERRTTLEAPVVWDELRQEWLPNFPGRHHLRAGAASK